MLLKEIMLLAKIPKRNIVAYPGEFADFLSCIKNSSLISGHFVEKFENRFAEFLNVKHAIAVSSGRFAINLILNNLGLKKTDEVILAAYNFPGMPKALLRTGFDIRLVDVSPDTYQIDIESLKRNITPKTKVIIAIHLFGHSCELGQIVDIAKSKRIFLIEDAAHSLGTKYNGKYTSTIGDAGFFSFTGSKMLNTAFGGMIVTNDDNLAVCIRRDLNNYGFPEKKELITEIFKRYIYILFSNRLFYTISEYPISLLMSTFNKDMLQIYKKFKKDKITERGLRFTNLQGVMGFKQVDFVKKIIYERKKRIKALMERLNPSIFVQKSVDNSEPNYFMFALKTKNKFKVFKYLLKKGIDTNLSYTSDCSCFLGGSRNPNSEFLSKSILTINLPFNLTYKEIAYVGDVINSASNMLY